MFWDGILREDIHSNSEGGLLILIVRLGEVFRKIWPLQCPFLSVQLTLGANESAVVEGRVGPSLRCELGTHRPQPPPGREELHLEYSTVHFLCCDLSLFSPTT